MKWDIVLMVVLMAALVLLFAIQYVRRNKYNAGLSELRKDLKSGDKVMTDSGLVGTIVDFYEEEGYRYVVLKSGKDDFVGYFTVPASAIYYVYGKDFNTKSPNTNQTNTDTNETKTEEKKSKTSKKSK